MVIVASNIFFLFRYYNYLKLTKNTKKVTDFMQMLPLFPLLCKFLLGVKAKLIEFASTSDKGGERSTAVEIGAPSCLCSLPLYTFSTNAIFPFCFPLSYQV